MHLSGTVFSTQFTLGPAKYGVLAPEYCNGFCEVLLDGNTTSFAGASTAAWPVAANSNEVTTVLEKEFAMAKTQLFRGKIKSIAIVFGHVSVIRPSIYSDRTPIAPEPALVTTYRLQLAAFSVSGVPVNL